MKLFEQVIVDVQFSGVKQATRNNQSRGGGSSRNPEQLYADVDFL